MPLLTWGPKVLKVLHWRAKYHVTITDATQILLIVKAADRLRKDMI